jgi:hypothetical protein
MRYLFFTNTPAHVHMYKHAAARLRDEGHEVLVLGRDYGCTVPLLRYTDLPFRVYGECDTTKGSLFRELPRHYVNIARLTRRFDPDLIFGMGSYAAHAGLMTQTPVVLLVDSEPTSLDHLLSQPFANAILTPHAFRKDLGENHYRFRGFKESAYLHPEVFSPRGDIRDRLGLDEDEEYAILRLNAFGSHHDVNQSGFGPADRRTLIDRLSEDVTVLVSDEGGDMRFDDVDAEPFDLHPALLHDALAEASLLVADTQTMVTEAALLGTPAVRSNSFVGDDDMGNFVELERQGLVYNVGEFEAVLERSERLLDDDAAAAWQDRRDEYVDGLVNVTDVLTSVASRVNAVEMVPELQRS